MARHHRPAARGRLSRVAIARIAAQYVRRHHRLALQRADGEITDAAWVHAMWTMHETLVERRSEFDRARLQKSIARLARKACRRS